MYKKILAPAWTAPIRKGALHRGSLEDELKAISTIARLFRQNGGGEQTRAKDIMSTPVLTISPDATVGEAAGLMLEKQVSCLPVVDDEEQLVGMLTHSDFELHRKLIGMTDDLYELLGTCPQQRPSSRLGRSPATTACSHQTPEPTQTPY